MMSSASGSGGNPIMPMINDTLMMNDTLVPMNSSGFGSGSGQAPVISNCSISLSAVTVMPQLGLFSVNISVMLTAMDNGNPSSITFSATNPMQESSLVPNTTIEGDGSVLTVTINGDILNSISMPTTELNITIFASDGFTNSEACILPVTIEYLPISECSAARTTEQQNTEPVEREINAIYIQVEQSASEVSGGDNMISEYSEFNISHIWGVFIEILNSNDHWNNNISVLVSMLVFTLTHFPSCRLR